MEKIQAKLSKIKAYNQSIMTVEITLRDEARQYTNYRAFFDCDANGRCQIDCDGGSADISLAKDGQLLLKNNGFVIYGGCDGEVDGIMLEALAGGDDLFKLTKLPPAFCQNITDYK